jgi:integrase
MRKPRKQKRVAGIYPGKAGGYEIDKRFLKVRIRESCPGSSFVEAQEILAARIDEIRRFKKLGERPQRLWCEAATHYLQTKIKRSLRDDADQLLLLDPFIGSLPIDKINMGTLAPFIKARRKQKVKNRTVNAALQVVRQILNLAAADWIEDGVTWLDRPPKIKLLPVNDARQPYPIDWDEQERLFKELPAHIAAACLVAVNCGAREDELCQLRWSWEIQLKRDDCAVFVIPATFAKSACDRILIINRIGKSVIENQRGQHRERVFTWRGKPLDSLNNTAFQAARKRANLAGKVRFHDLRHTYAFRLRSANVDEETRRDLLGHKSGRSITTHYSQPELNRLIVASNAICDLDRGAADLMVVMGRVK